MKILYHNSLDMVQHFGFWMMKKIPIFPLFQMIFRLWLNGTIFYESF